MPWVQYWFVWWAFWYSSILSRCYFYVISSSWLCSWFSCLLQLHFLLKTFCTLFLYYFDYRNRHVRNANNDKTNLWQIEWNQIHNRLHNINGFEKTCCHHVYCRKPKKIFPWKMCSLSRLIDVTPKYGAIARTTTRKSSIFTLSLSIFDKFLQTDFALATVAHLYLLEGQNVIDRFFHMSINH